MPYELKFTLDASQARALPENCAPALHSTLFERLKASDAAVSDAVHAQTLRKPFTVSPLRVEGDRAYFRFTLLDDRLYDYLQAGVEQDPIVQVTGQRLPLVGRPKVRHQAYSDLVNEAGQDTTVILQFESPTSFKAGSVHNPFPEPMPVFRSYLARWNIYAPPHLRVHESWLEQWVRRAVGVARFQVTSHETFFKHRPAQAERSSEYEQIGCVGVVQYELAQVDRDVAKALRPFNFLAEYATYCGTGHRTTQGMGQTRRLSRWPREGARENA